MSDTASEDDGPGPTKSMEIAAWMYTEILERNYLPQKRAARDIRKMFGQQFVHKNANGNWGINNDILKDFDELSKDDVVWVRSDRKWRKRKPTDKPGRQQP